MKVDRAGIARLVPHAGAMCLLDGVTDWTPTWIACTSAAPAAGHPLARGHRVPAIMAAEYAAQATAVHGALLEESGRPRAGMLAALMDVQLAAPWLPCDGGALSIRADVLSRSPAGCLYSFEVGAAGTAIASGRLMVVLLAQDAP
jgi:predicted hotdog family 3-hydroxylacyl-ACP dehydratase